MVFEVVEFCFDVPGAPPAPFRSPAKKPRTAHVNHHVAGLEMDVAFVNCKYNSQPSHPQDQLCYLLERLEKRLKSQKIVFAQHSCIGFTVSGPHAAHLLTIHCCVCVHKSAFIPSLSPQSALFQGLVASLSQSVTHGNTEALGATKRKDLSVVVAPGGLRTAAKLLPQWQVHTNTC